MNPIVPFAYYRPPSVAWERVSVARIPGLELHAWFRPAPLPYGLSIMLPEGSVGNGQVLADQSAGRLVLPSVFSRLSSSQQRCTVRNGSPPVFCIHG